MRSLSFSMNSGVCGMHFGPSIMTEYGLTQEAQISSLLYYFRVLRGVESDKKYVALQGYPIKVMIWGAIGPGFKSSLQKFETKVTADAYQKMLTSSEIFEKLNHRFGKGAFVFQQDGACPHTAASTREFLADKAVTLPDELHWPAQSPDLNVIENLWALLKKNMDYSRISNAETLYDEAVRVLNALSIDVVNHCLEDFYPRLLACSALRGESLNEHKPVLCAFRRSTQEGLDALSASVNQQQEIQAFCTASREFFVGDARRLVLRKNMPESAGPSEIEEQNHAIWNESVRICSMLPRKIRRKTQLPRSTQDFSRLGGTSTE